MLYINGKYIWSLVLNGVSLNAMNDSFLTVKGEAQAQFVEQRSRFISFIWHIPALGQSDNKAEIIEIIEIVDDNSNGRPSSSTVNTFDYKPDEDGVYNVAETMPEFPSGTRALLDWLDKNIVYPDFCLKNKIQGRVMVSFVVDKDGSILSPEVLKGIYASLDKEAVRLVSSMPKWNAGTQRGKPVRVKYTVPINFRLG